MYTNTDNIEILIGNEADEIIEELLNLFRKEKTRKGLNQIINQFLFDIFR